MLFIYLIREVCINDEKLKNTKGRISHPPCIHVLKNNKALRETINKEETSNPFEYLEREALEKALEVVHHKDTKKQFYPTIVV